MGAMGLKSSASRLFTQPFIQAQIKENIKAPRHFPLCAQRASNAENVAIWWRHHDIYVLFSLQVISSQCQLYCCARRDVETTMNQSYVCVQVRCYKDKTQNELLDLRDQVMMIQMKVS